MKAETTPCPLRVLYDARTCRPGMTGVGRYALNLLHALGRLPDEVRVRALFYGDGLDAAQRDDQLQNIEILEAPMSHEAHPGGDLWLRWGLRKWVEPGEIFHSPAFVLPGGSKFFPRVVTIHDVIVFTHPETYPMGFGWYLRRATRIAANVADVIITPTAVVADQIAELGLARREKIVVTHQAADATPPCWEAASENQSEALPALPEAPLFLTIGGPDPRKDPLTALRAAIAIKEKITRTHNDLNFEWWWVGRGMPEDEEVPRELARLAPEVGFRFLPHAGKAFLRTALNHAQALVSTSWAEGFNLTLVEAMAVGCPVVASDIPVHREVAGQAAQFFTINDHQALADLLYSWLLNPALRAPAVRASREHGEHFAWDRTARTTLAAYSKSEA